MTRWYCSGACHVCTQGRPVIMRDLGRHYLYFHCGECESGWREPQGRSFLTLDEEADARPATLDEIRLAGWGKYVAGYWDE
jgi:hypothetical protein